MSAVPTVALPLPSAPPAVGAPARPVRPGRTPAPAVRPARRRLEVVSPPLQARTRAPFVALCMGVLAASLLGTLLLNTAMAQGEYERIALQSRLAQSALEQQRLVEATELAESPAQIAAAAERLGMVPAPNGGYLRLADGAVIGDPVPAGAGG